MFRSTCVCVLAALSGFGLVFVAQSAWAISCTATGSGNPACQTDPHVPNTWFIPANPDESDAQTSAEQTMTLTFPGATLTHTGVFDILEQQNSTGVVISDQIQVVHANGGDTLIFDSDPFTPLTGSTTLGTEDEHQGIVTSLDLGNGFAAVIGSDGEAGFNPIGVGGGQDLSDFVQITPEPATIALAVSGIAPFALAYLRRRRTAKAQAGIA